MDDRTSRGARWLPRALFVSGTAVAAVTVLYLLLLGWMTTVEWTRGRDLLLLLTPAFGVLAYILLARGRGGSRGAPVRWLAAAVALAALWPAWQGYQWMRGPQAYAWTWWQAEKPESAQPIGAWQRPAQGLVRVRTDALFLYNGEGRSAGGRKAPEGTAFCALSRTIAHDIGLLAAARPSGGCGTRVSAVDLEQGKELWAKDFPAAPPADGTSPPVAVVDTTAVVVTEGALLGVDLRGGGESWRTPVPAGCRARALDGAADRVLYVEDCPGAGSARLVSLDARTGTPAWQTPLRVGPSAELRMLSAQPVALRAGDTVRLFDDAGRERGAVPVVGPKEDLLPEPGPIVSGDLLVLPVKAKAPGVSAYSLLDGRRVWHAGLDGATVLGLAQGRAPGGVDVVTSTAARTHLWHLDGTTGRADAEPTILRDVPLGRRFEIYPTGVEGYTFVNLDPSGELPSYVALKRVRDW
ncbi:PQQ-like beta-propeller repeat protein [Streptomyces yangpuensis]|uniref:PQQ-like beta-propeller repeat protein n=1 Tax=Streptomyces yangpuensis TaxID=1648182 RepID=A0ABY5PWB2_9ACTN|nr:PQQ-like beta-propeller repeat protein [Streptomyces yangpuensis]MBZ9596566.1 PQQ-like beta-propeller repeat protein [Streptomyces erythrochromogenes]UUY48447.1 PQQ-like beta-propeller repeat protein [Streptomyces yangpuensis]